MIPATVINSIEEGSHLVHEDGASSPYVLIAYTKNNTAITQPQPPQNDTKSARVLVFAIGVIQSFFNWAIYQGCYYASLTLFGNLDLNLTVSRQSFLFMAISIVGSAIYATYALLSIISPWLSLDDDAAADENDSEVDKIAKKENADISNALATYGILGLMLGYVSFDFFLTKHVYKYLTGIAIEYGRLYFVIVFVMGVIVIPSVAHVSYVFSETARREERSIKHNISASSPLLAQII